LAIGSGNRRPLPSLPRRRPGKPGRNDPRPRCRRRRLGGARHRGIRRSGRDVIQAQRPGPVIGPAAPRSPDLGKRDCQRAPRWESSRRAVGSLQPAYQKVLERNPRGGVGSGQRRS